MPEYRHATNLRRPFAKIDEDFLAALGDYRTGPAIPAKHRGAYTAEQLEKQGVVGIYTTAEALARPEMKHRTGWIDPERVLGQALDQP